MRVPEYYLLDPYQATNPDQIIAYIFERNNADHYDLTQKHFESFADYEELHIEIMDLLEEYGYTLIRIDDGLKVFMFGKYDYASMKYDLYLPSSVMEKYLEMHPEIFDMIGEISEDYKYLDTYDEEESDDDDEESDDDFNP